MQLFSINNYVILFSEFSVVLLIFAAGLEHGFSAIRRSGINAVLAAVFGAVVPFLGTYLVFLSIYPQYTALIIATATGATSLAVVAGVIQMERLQGTRGTDFLLTAASLDDVVTFVMLSAVLTVVTGESSTGRLFAGVVGSVVAWLLILGISVKVIPWVFNRIRAIYINSLAMVTLFGLVVLMSLLNFSPVVAAFVAGVAIAESVKVTERIRHMTDVLLSIFGSIFFVVIGMQFNVNALDPGVLANALLLSLLASAFKFLGFLPFAYIQLRDRWASVTVSLGMIPRGEMGLVVGSIGYSLGILNEGEFNDVVLMALITTILGAILYKYAASRLKEES
jgi:Kef-type K+ transport system membrane component KefB